MRLLTIPAIAIASLFVTAALRADEAAPLFQATPTITPDTPVPPSPPTKVKIVETTFDAGSVWRGEAVSHSFVLQNVGDKDLFVDAKPGCGCTVMEFDKVIAPGASGKVNARVDTAQFKGPISKSIALTLNDPDQSRVTLIIKADVKVPIDVQPNDTAMFSGKAGELAPYELTLVAPDDAVFDVLTATSNGPSFTTAVAAAPLTGTSLPTKPGQLASGSSRYKVTITPSSNIPVGILRGGELVLTTSHPKQPEIKIRLHGNITGDVDVAPARAAVVTGADATPEQKVARIMLTKAAGGLEIRSVESDSASLKTTLTTVAEGSQYQLDIEYIGAVVAAKTSPTAAEVVVMTNDARQARIEIPVALRPESTQLIKLTPHPPGTGPAPGSAPSADRVPLHVPPR